MKFKGIIFFIILLLPINVIALPAFPDAEGHGSDTVGGRGGTLYKVTNLNDSGTGSFRAACEASGARIVVFDTGGTITLVSNIEVDNPYLTVAGQTAPGDGICIRDGAIRFRAHDIIVRGLRFRVGDESAIAVNQLDGISAGHPTTVIYNVIIDHCSVAWALDENLSLWNEQHDITFSWNITGEALHQNLHSMGFLIGHSTTNISIHHNLIASNNGRNPSSQGAGDHEIINNVIYNWGEQAYFTINDDDTKGSSVYNFINNYSKEGPDTGAEPKPEIAFDVSTHDDTELYVSGNTERTGPGIESTQWDLVWNPSNATQAGSPIANAWGVTTQSASDAYTDVLAGAGAYSNDRDSVDTRIVASVGADTGNIIDSQDDVGGWPSYVAGTAPTDTDGDGMSDIWETANGTNPAVDDGNNTSSSGYTNIEDYINSFFDTDTFTGDPSLSNGTIANGEIH